MTDRPELTAVLRETDWLRRLARKLTRDCASADDLVQETLHRALRSRPEFGGRGPRPWLATVARNLARNEVGRRNGGPLDESDEQLTAPDPAAADAAARVELQRQLAEQLLALEEPYRSVLLLRFHDGLSIAKTAARLRAPKETVRTRQRRGLELLRARLDRRHGGSRASWLLPFTAAFGSGGVPWGTLMRTTMENSSKLVVGAVVALALGAGLLFGWDRLRPRSTVAEETVAEGDEGSPRRADQTLTRQAVEAPGTTAQQPVPATAAGWSITGRLLAEESWRALPGVSVELVLQPAEREHVRRGVDATTTDDDGRFHLRGPRDVGRASLDVIARAPERARVIRQVDLDPALRAPRDADLGDVLVPPGTHVSGRVLDAAGRPAPDAQLYLVPDCVPRPPGNGPGLWAIAREAFAVGRSGIDGRFRLDEPLTARRVTPPLLVAIHEDGVGWTLLHGLRRARHELHDLDVRMQPGVDVDVVVTGPDGSPAGDVPVLAIPQQGPLGGPPPSAELARSPFRDRFTARTDPSTGVATLRGLPAEVAAYALHVGEGDDAARTLQSFAVDPTRHRVNVEVTLGAQQRIPWTVSIRDRDDRPVAEATWQLGGDVAHSDSTGRIAVQLDGSEDGRRWSVRAAGMLTARGILRLPAEGPPDPLEIALDPARTVLGRVVEDDGRPVARARVSITHDAAFTDSDGRFVLDPAPCTDLRIVVDPSGPRPPWSTNLAAEATGEQRFVLPPWTASRAGLVVWLHDVQGRAVEARSMTLIHDSEDGTAVGPELRGRIGRAVADRGLEPGDWSLRVLTVGGAELLDAFTVTGREAAVERRLVEPVCEPIRVHLDLAAADLPESVTIRYEDDSQRAGVRAAADPRRLPLQQTGTLALRGRPELRIVGRDPERALALSIQVGESRAHLRLPPGPAARNLTLSFRGPTVLRLDCAEPWPDDAAALYLWRDGEPKGPSRPYPLRGLRGRTHLFQLEVEPGTWHYELRADGRPDGAVRAAGQCLVEAGRRSRIEVDR